MGKKVFRTAFKTALSFLISIFFIFHRWRHDSSMENKVQKVEKASSEFRPWYFEGGSLRPQHGAERQKLWPDEANGDRILNQLMFVPEKESRSTKKIFFSNFKKLKFQKGSQIFHRLNCPVKNCEVVVNQTLADAVVFEHFVSVTRGNSFNQIWILHSLESPYFSGNVIQQTSVNWTASYRTDSDLVTPYDKWVYYDERNKATTLQRNFAAEKTKKVAWFVSNCYSKNKRLEYAKILSKYISVDIYGACGDNVCLKSADDYCRNIVLRNYKFYLSFENANCRDYITEKFYRNALRVDVIPIVMGAPKKDYEKVAPYNSFIHVEDFRSPKHLADYLNHLDKNDEEYNSYFLWKGAGEFINTYFMCRLCALLHAEHKSQYYRRITHWWRRPGICIKSFWNDTNKDHILRSLRNHRTARKIR